MGEFSRTLSSYAFNAICLLVWRCYTNQEFIGHEPTSEGGLEAQEISWLADSLAVTRRDSTVVRGKEFTDTDAEILKPSGFKSENWEVESDPLGQ